MKKSLLALAVVAAATSANAATVYDKDGTSLAVGGRVQAVVYNGNAAGIAENDAGLVNSARLNIAGSTKINDSVSVFAFSEWNMADGNTSGQSWGDSINTREQYVGADYGDFGKILGGKTYDAANAVLAATDVFEDFGARLQSSINGDRRTGMFRYVYDNNGIFGSVSYQTAADGSTVKGKKADVEGGFAAAAGYTFDNVVFGPLSLKAGYSYVKGQDDKGSYLQDVFAGKNNYKFDDFKVISASVAWGSTDSGLYIGALYNTQRAKLRLSASNSSLADKVKGYEFVVGYTFDNGIGAFTGYNFVDQKYKVGSINQGTATIRRVPVYVNYAINGNFNIWGEAEFDANSSTTKDGQRQYPEFETGTMLSAGARYTF
ncbi:MAG: porin [Succinivibrio sp.]|nr:porin [Succinatimonas sp.]MDY5064166.1 porin [Succinivibrio sp.]